MSHPNPDRDERVRQIRERQAERAEWAYGKDIQFLLDLLDSQAAGDSPVCVNCGRAVAYAEYGPPINDAHWYHVDTQRRTCDEAASVEELIAAEDSGRLASPAPDNAATRMRDACVEKVRELRVQWHDSYVTADTSSKEALVRKELLFAQCQAANKIITALQSLTLEVEEEQ